MIILTDFGEAWVVPVFILVGVVVGAIIGFFVARYFLKKQIEKNPPINEKMIRAMFMQMGRKPSESQIRAVMNSMKNQK
ncbi:MAG: YneF family protein [Bacilli bacterium]